MADKEYIERGALLKTPPFTKYGGYPSEYVEGYLDCAEEARKAVNDAPAADVISRGVFEQVKWERDMAMQQLEEHGIPFCGKADDVVKVVRMPVVGYEDKYVVDQFGRVYGVDRTTTVFDNGRIYEKPIAGKQMKQSLHTKGYKTVSLTKDGKAKTMFVHRIVAEAFIPNTDNLPMVNHKDEDKTNNFVENLEWCTASYNRTYGNAVEKHAKKIRGRKHTTEHKKKISDGVKRSCGEREEQT